MESANSRWWYCQHIAAGGNEDHKNAYKNNVPTVKM